MFLLQVSCVSLASTFYTKTALPFECPKVEQPLASSEIVDIKYSQAIIEMVYSELIIVQIQVHFSWLLKKKKRPGLLRLFTSDKTKHRAMKELQLWPSI